MATRDHYDAIVIGSGFGGSVSALRLAEKGYRVLVLEKGRRFAPEDFPKTNWDLRRWMWMPRARDARHLQDDLLRARHGGARRRRTAAARSSTRTRCPCRRTRSSPSGSWARPRRLEERSSPRTTRPPSACSAPTRNPTPDLRGRVMREIARDIGREKHFHPTDVAVYFGEPGQDRARPVLRRRGARPHRLHRAAARA